MSRTTLNIDTPILRELRRLHEREGRPMGELASELLSEALAMRRKGISQTSGFHWISKPMQARVNLEDKDALYTLLEEDGTSS